MVDEVTQQGPLGSPSGQMFQRGMNFLFGKPTAKGMVQAAPKPVAPITQAPIQQPAAPKAVPQIAPPIDLKSPNNVMTYVDSIS